MMVNVAAFSAGYCVRPFEGPKGFDPMHWGRFLLQESVKEAYE
jgi:hypothetical protein